MLPLSPSHPLNGLEEPGSARPTWARRICGGVPPAWSSVSWCLRGRQARTCVAFHHLSTKFDPSAEIPFSGWVVGCLEHTTGDLVQSSCLKRLSKMLTPPRLTSYLSPGKTRCIEASTTLTAGRSSATVFCASEHRCCVGPVDQETQCTLSREIDVVLGTDAHFEFRCFR
jgi:hypothetical protein